MSESTKNQAVVIERTFKASPDVIWSMWTDPALFKQWYGPNGASVPSVEIELEVGGRRLVCMEFETPQGKRAMWTVGHHLEIVPNERLVFTEAISDEKGNMQPAGPGQPGETKIILEFEDLDGSTLLTLRHEGVPAGSPGKIGWQQALDKLGQKLA